MRPNSERVPQFYGLSTFDDRGRDEFIDPMPLSTGHKLVLAPEDESRRVLISSDSELNLFDGRVLAQNGTFVVRSFLPADKNGKVLEWFVEASYDPEWVREPTVGFSQIGYTPAQKKVAVVELDRNDTPEKTAGIFRVDDSGNSIKVMEGNYDNKRGTAQTQADDSRAKLGVGEYIDKETGRRTYGSGKATIPQDAPPRPSDKHAWDSATAKWVLL